MTVRSLLLLALGAANLSGCVAAVAIPVAAPLLAFPSSAQGDDSPKITDAVSPTPGEATFYNIVYEDHDTRYPAPQPEPEPEPGIERHRSDSVYGVDDDYAATWQTLGAQQTFLTVQDVDLKYPDGSMGKRRIVRLKATAQSPGIEGANPSFTGIRQVWPRATYTTRVIYTPQKDGDRAGILAWQDHQHYIFCGASRLDGKPAAVLVRRNASDEPAQGLVEASYPLDAQSFKDLGFRIEIQDGRLSCAFIDPKHGLFYVGASLNVFAGAAKSPTDQGVMIGAHAFSAAP